MKLAKLTDNTQNNSLEQPQQRQTLQKLSRNLAAKHFASAEAVKTQNTNSGNASRQEDIAKLSDQAVKAVSDSGQISEVSRPDQILAALKQSMDELPKNVASKRQIPTPGKRGNKKKRVVKRKEEWTPTLGEGAIRPGRVVIGRIKVTEEVKEVPSQESRAGSGSSSTSSGRSGQGANGSAPSSNPGTADPGNQAVGSHKAQGHPATSSDQESKSDDQGVISKESNTRGQRERAGTAASQNLQKQGLQAPGLAQGIQNGAGSKKAAGNHSVGEFDVRTRATGVNQRLTVRAGGELSGNSILGTFRTLDNKPILKSVTLHSRNTEEAAREIKKKAVQQGESPEKVREMLELLRNKHRPDDK